MWQIPDAVDTVVCAPDDVWKYLPKHVEQFPDINKLCNVASCWIYIGVLLGAHPILHISRIRVIFSHTAISGHQCKRVSCQFSLTLPQEKCAEFSLQNSHFKLEFAFAYDFIYLVCFWMDMCK